MTFIGHCIRTLHNWSIRYCYRCGSKVMELKQYTSSLINPIFCQCCNIIQNIDSVYTQHTLHILCQVCWFQCYSKLVILSKWSFMNILTQSHVYKVSCMSCACTLGSSQWVFHTLDMAWYWLPSMLWHLSLRTILQLPLRHSLTIHAAYAHHPYNSNKTHWFYLFILKASRNYLCQHK